MLQVSPPEYKPEPEPEPEPESTYIAVIYYTDEIISVNYGIFKEG